MSERKFSLVYQNVDGVAKNVYTGEIEYKKDTAQ